MKIVLATGTEYQATAASVTEDDKLCISLTGLNEPLNEAIVRKSFTLAAMSAVKFYTDDTEYTVYEGYTLLDFYNVKMSENSFDMTLYFSKYADNIRVTALEENYNVLFDVINYVLLELIPSIKLSV